MAESRHTFIVSVQGNDREQAEQRLGRCLADYNSNTDDKHPGRMAYLREPGD